MVFQCEQWMIEIGWTRQATARARTAASLHGRDRIREALETSEFALR